jgi:hypothetical protein
VCVCMCVCLSVCLPVCLSVFVLCVRTLTLSLTHTHTHTQVEKAKFILRISNFTFPVSNLFLVYLPALEQSGVSRITYTKHTHTIHTHNTHTHTHTHTHTQQHVLEQTSISQAVRGGVDGVEDCLCMQDGVVQVVCVWVTCMWKYISKAVNLTTNDYTSVPSIFLKQKKKAQFLRAAPVQHAHSKERYITTTSLSSLTDSQPSYNNYSII